jgi:hypothetical protein
MSSAKPVQIFAVLVAIAWVGCSSKDGATGATVAGDGGTDPGAPPPGSPPGAPDADAGGDAASTDAGDDANAPRNDSPGCVSYCDTVLSACTPNYVQFPSKIACLNACQYYPPGTPPDYGQNSLACRDLMAINAAGGDPEAHCLHAGPYGYGGCGDMCEAFCQIVMPWCGSLSPFASHVACTTECNLWAWAPSLPDGGAAYRASGPLSGDTLDCREVMLVLSLQGPAERAMYCPLTATNSATCH